MQGLFQLCNNPPPHPAVGGGGGSLKKYSSQLVNTGHAGPPTCYCGVVIIMIQYVLKVQGLFQWCNPGHAGPPTCNCGVVITIGDATFIMDRCRTKTAKCPGTVLQFHVAKLVQITG